MYDPVIRAAVAMDAERNEKGQTFKQYHEYLKGTDPSVNKRRKTIKKNIEALRCVFIIIIMNRYF